MTVPAFVETIDYTATGAVNEQFTIPANLFFFADSEIRMWTLDGDDVATLLVLGTHYTVTGAGNPAGGTVTVVTGQELTPGITVKFDRWVDIFQQVELPEAGSLPSTAIERGLDRLVMMVQQLALRLGAEDFAISLSAFLHRSSTEPEVWDGEGKIARNFADPVQAQDLVTKTFFNQFISAGGNVPAPLDPAEIGFVLVALAGGLFDWFAPPVPTPADPADDGKVPVAAGGSSAWKSQAVPEPVAGDTDRILEATGEVEGAFAWRDFGRRNFLINGDMRIAERGLTFTSATTPANSDDTYLLDRWNLLSDGNDIVDVSRDDTVIPAQGYSSIKFDVETQDKKFGLVQIIEARNAARIRGRRVSLSFKARTTVGAVVRNIRAAVISWSGVEDTVTSDVVAAWAAEGTNPTLAANWTYENVAVDLPLNDGDFTTFKIENINIDTAGMKNVAVFIWCDDDDAAVGDFLWVTDVQLEAGATAHEYQHRHLVDELASCQYYFENLALVRFYSYNPNVAAAQAIGGHVHYATNKRTMPTIALTLVTTVLVDSTTAVDITTRGFSLRGNFVGGAAGAASMHATCTASCEL